MKRLYRSLRHQVAITRSRIDWQLRRATSSKRVLPGLVIIGAQKSGTTSLYDYLIEHPQLLPASNKEVHFFDGGLTPELDAFTAGEAWYRAHFPLVSSVQAGQHSLEATPLYLFNPLVAARMHELIPEVKLIAILRNPTERAISHFFHEKRYGREPLSIAEAMAAEEERLKPAWENEDFKDEAFIHLSYKSRGHYAEQLARYLKYFPRESLLVLSAERFFGQPSEALAQVCCFMDIGDDYRFENLQPRNTASNRVKVEPAVYESLNEYFTPHNQALADLLKEDFAW